MPAMNVTHEYLLKSRQLTWENAEVIDNLFGPVLLEVKNEDWKKAHQNTSKNCPTYDSLATQRGCVEFDFVSQHGYEEIKKKTYIHLDYNKVINVRVLIVPVDLDANMEPPSSLPESISSSEGAHLIIASPSKCSQGDDRNECGICHKKFQWKSDLTVHLRTHTGDKPFSCPQCEKKFAEKGSLKKHLLIHSGVKEYACKICYRRFGHKSSLTVHLRTHTGDKPFGCPQCGRSFSRSGHLKTHLLVHSGVKCFSCDICFKKFTQKSNLTVHRRTHTGDKLFICTECNARFLTSGHLKEHMKTHTGKTPYQCEICKRKFTYICSLKDHLLIHSEEKPFACTYENCDKTLRTKGNLQTHVRVHTNNKPYSCPKCHKTFSQSSHCKTHAKHCSVNKSVSADGSFILRNTEEVGVNSEA